MWVFGGRPAGSGYVAYGFGADEPLGPIVEELMGGGDRDLYRLAGVEHDPGTSGAVFDVGDGIGSYVVFAFPFVVMSYADQLQGAPPFPLSLVRGWDIYSVPVNEEISALFV
jgi:hypothetical protein